MIAADKQTLFTSALVVLERLKINTTYQHLNALLSRVHHFGLCRNPKLDWPAVYSYSCKVMIGQTKSMAQLHLLRKIILNS